MRELATDSQTETAMFVAEKSGQILSRTASRRRLACVMSKGRINLSWREGYRMAKNVKSRSADTKSEEYLRSARVQLSIHQRIAKQEEADIDKTVRMLNSLTK